MIGAHAVAAAWLALLALPIVLFYFLKLRRSRLELPSLALWRQVIEDRRVNSPFQRLKRHLLLYLQLLMLALIVLAAMQPFLHSGGARLERVPVLIDVSASMGARADGGATRLDEAKKLVAGMIDAQAADQQLCLIAVGRVPRRLTGFTDDRRELTRALESLAPEEAAADVAAALHLAQAMGRADPFQRAVLVSDGNVPDPIDVDLAFRMDYRLVGSGTANAGITACSARRRSDRAWELMVAIESSADASGAATLALLVDGEPAATRDLLLTPGGADRASFRVEGGGDVEVRLDVQGFDALAVDDRAFLSLPALKPVRVAVAASLPAWRKAMSAQPDVEIVASEPDIVIADGITGDDRASLRVAVGAVPAELTALVERGDGASSVVDYQRSHPLLAHVVLDDLVVAQRIAWAPGIGENNGESAAELLGWRVLVHGDRGPLLVAHERAGGADLALLFHTDRSTLPFRLGFPVLIGNLVAHALHLRGQDEIVCAPAGTLPALTVAPGSEVTVVDPDGASASAVAGPDGAVVGVAAPRAGFYRLSGAGIEQVVGVGLVDTRESRLTRVDTLRVREVAVDATPAAPTERGLWRALAAAALVIALIEWWVAHRRPLIGNARAVPT
ncbi:MAG TPA: VWA domain-containing protein [Planctomycetota bacterium]|nr:VWA domain-containing protein [Planctomycetota bacterium]